MKPELSISLESDKVLLRPLVIGDENSLQEIANEKSLWTYGLSNLSCPGELNRYIQKAIKKREEGSCAVWTVIDKSSNRVAGSTRLGEISWKDERGQVGWTWIGKDFQGSGLNKAMKFLIVEYGFNTLNLNRIELKADERNLKSRKAILSIGAKEEGILRQHMKTQDGYLRNTVFYSILKSEWEVVKRSNFAGYI